MHLGAAWALLMGLSSFSIASPPPGLDVPDNRLPAVCDVDVLNGDGLLTAVSVFAQRLDLRGQGAGELIEAGVLGLPAAAAYHNSPCACPPSWTVSSDQGR